MRIILLSITAAHINSVAAVGYGPRIIIAALRDRLVDKVYLVIDQCWLMMAHKGARHYIHLPLHILPFTLGRDPVRLLLPIAFRLPVPAELVKPRSRSPRRPRA